MNKVKQLLDVASLAYRNGASATREARDVATHCLDLLSASAKAHDLASCGGKEYSVWKDGKAMSRPVLKDGLLDKATFLKEWAQLVAAADGKNHRYAVSVDEANRVTYTAISAVSVAFDLWKPKSRKTPGTYFEILLGSLLQNLLPGHNRLKHVILPGETENVATDIVFAKPNSPGGLVMPAKITTRERIVQAFAHQRILDSYFGAGVYKSVLICVSEMQRDEEANANEICVPGAIRLYQKHLAPMTAIYYLDPPSRYLQADVTNVVAVKRFGELLVSDLPALV